MPACIQQAGLTNGRVQQRHCDEPLLCLGLAGWSEALGGHAQQRTEGGMLVGLSTGLHRRNMGDVPCSLLRA